MPANSNTLIHVFSDGSAFMQDQPTCTLAGAAVIKVEPGTNNYTIVDAQPLPGVDHSSYRGEGLRNLFGTTEHFKTSYLLRLSICGVAIK